MSVQVMDSMAQPDLDGLLGQGIAAARAGDKREARALLLQVIDLNDQVEDAWLWLSGVVDEAQERQICLENVLTLNPDNETARKGLAWLQSQVPADPAEPTPSSPVHMPDGPPPVQVAVAAEVPLPLQSETSPSQPARKSVTVSIDPFGCPFCGGSISDVEPICDHCRRSVALRYRKREDTAGIARVVVFFLLLGLASGLEGYFVSQLVRVGQFPGWMNTSAISLLVGPALFGLEGVGELVRFASAVVLINYVLAGLCVVDALGLALRSRTFYFVSFLLAGIMVMVTVAALLAQLTGWLPTVLRLALIAITLKWLADSAPAFEWTTRVYDADIDKGLRSDLDYHNRAQIYYDQGMWAKAAAHWKVASRLAPGQAQYRAELANSYLRMGYAAAALVEADRALALAPADQELHVFRAKVARLEADQ